MRRLKLIRRIGGFMKEARSARFYVGVFSAVIVGVGLLVAIVLGAQHQPVKGSYTTQATLTQQSDPRMATSYNEMFDKLSPEDKELAKTSKKSIGFHRTPDGKVILLEVDGKKVHEDPAKKFLKDYKKNPSTDTLDTLSTDRNMIEVTADEKN